MDIAATNAIERVALVIAGLRLSGNADGDEAHAGASVDLAWRDHRDDAIAILKSLREPDESMERAGDIAVWQRMMAAALGEPGREHAERDPVPEPGTDPLHEGP